MSAPRAVPDPKTSEAAFQKDVMAAAKLFGWVPVHVSASMTGRGRWTTATNIAGWPDLVLLRPKPDGDGDILYAELKTDAGKLSAAQVAMVALIRGCGGVCEVWRPRDWESIVERLAA